MASVAGVRLKIGMEVHVELATRSKMFARAPSPACEDSGGEPAPNSLIDPVVLALPGALPVINQRAVELAVRVGLSLNCSIAPLTRWDRKSYFYPDLPKAYQISQYDLPLCFDGSFDLPPLVAHDRGIGEEGGGGGGGGGEAAIDFDALRAGVTGRRIGIIRAHLEEDAGKLLHEAPGGGAIDGSIVDLNRAGTPLLEIVTQPDFTSADEVVIFAQLLRAQCRLLGATLGVMQKGHIRFEPNINCVLTLDDGRTAVTPVVEVKNLNSFRSLRAAIEHERAAQPRRWEADGIEMGPGAKTTRGWDDAAGRTFVQREKEDAHDYRYFPDPDLPPLRLAPEWVASLRVGLPDAPAARLARYLRDCDLSPKEASALVDDPDSGGFFEAVASAAGARGVPDDRAARLAANLVLQSGLRRANESGRAVRALGLSVEHAAQIVALRAEGIISASGADELFSLLAEPGRERVDARALAAERGMIVVRDEAALEAWCARAIQEQAAAAADVRAGKDAALGRLVGAVMKLSGGRADGSEVKRRLLEMLGRS